MTLHSDESSRWGRAPCTGIIAFPAEMTERGGRSLDLRHPPLVGARVASRVPIIRSGLSGWITATTSPPPPPPTPFPLANDLINERR